MIKFQNPKYLFWMVLGSFNQVMGKIYEKKIDKAIFNALDDGGKILGYVRMQAFFYESEEGEAEGLKLIEGKVKKFNMNSPKYKVPHMGWNNVEFIKNGKFKSVFEENKFYFAHSFYVLCDNEKDILGTSSHSFQFTSVIKKNKIYGVQFHPEKRFII